MRGEETIAGQDLSRAVHPVLGKGGLDAGYQGTGDTGHAVTPLVLVGDVPLPLFRDGGPPGKADFAIDHRSASVIPAIDPHQVSKRQGTEPEDSYSGPLEIIAILLP
jgi:hypothetical protein